MYFNIFYSQIDGYEYFSSQDIEQFLQAEIS